VLDAERIKPSQLLGSLLCLSFSALTQLVWFGDRKVRQACQNPATHPLGSLISRGHSSPGVTHPPGFFSRTCGRRTRRGTSWPRLTWKTAPLEQDDRRLHFARAVHSRHPLPGRSHFQRTRQRRNDSLCCVTLSAIEWSLLQRARYSALSMGKKIPSRR